MKWSKIYKASFVQSISCLVIYTERVSKWFEVFNLKKSTKEMSFIGMLILLRIRYIVWSVWSCLSIHKASQIPNQNLTLEILRNSLHQFIKCNYSHHSHIHWQQIVTVVEQLIRSINYREMCCTECRNWKIKCK